MSKVILHVPDVWIDHNKTKIGYEIPFSAELHIPQILDLPIAYMIGGQVRNVDLSRATWQVF